MVQRAASAIGDAPVHAPRVLVFSTNAISDPGIDLAGISHMHYSPEVVVISLPCTSGVRPGWILHALEQGFDGVFIAADGEECGYLPDCTARSSRIVQAAQTLMAERGIDGSRVKMAAICSVCAENFAKHMTGFSEALVALRATEAAGASR
jgi:coenzyme F420-reducing hydrogenase delta subunit